jgi:hypothetical protein
MDALLFWYRSAQWVNIHRVTNEISNSKGIEIHTEVNATTCLLLTL